MKRCATASRYKTLLGKPSSATRAAPAEGKRGKKKAAKK
jgi:hypothetical protein